MDSLIQDSGNTAPCSALRYRTTQHAALILIIILLKVDCSPEFSHHCGELRRSHFLQRRPTVQAEGFEIKNDLKSIIFAYESRIHCLTCWG